MSGNFTAGLSVPTRSGSKALLFTLVPLIFLAALIAAAAAKQHWFSANDRLYAFADSGAGIAAGMPVKVKGFAVGVVMDVALVPPSDGKAPQVRIGLNIQREYMAYIGRDAILRLSRESLVGQPILELTEGDPRARRVADSDVLAFERPPGLNELVERFTSRTEPLLTEANDLLKKLKEPEGDLMNTLAAARRIASHVDDTTIAVGSMARAGERVLTRTETVLIPRIEGILDDVREVTTSAPSVVRRAEGLVGSGERLTSNAEEIVQGAKRSWPISLWVPKVPADPVRIDSQDNGKAFVVPREGPAQ